MTRGKQASRAGILFSDVKPKRLEWDWYPFIPRGKVVIVDGEPEEGKSAFILDLMARITTGRSMPFAAELRGWSEVPSREPRGVVFLSAEDDLDDTLIPRAMAAGADRTRLIAEHFDDPLDLDQQGFARLRQLIARVKAVAVVLDPLVSYIPDRVNLYVDQASRRLLRTLRAFAKESGGDGHRDPPLHEGGPTVRAQSEARRRRLDRDHRGRPLGADRCT
jgi:AAA domain